MKDRKQKGAGQGSLWALPSPALLALQVWGAVPPGLSGGSWAGRGSPGSRAPFSIPSSASPDFWARFCCSSCRAHPLSSLTHGAARPLTLPSQAARGQCPGTGEGSGQGPPGVRSCSGKRVLPRHWACAARTPRHLNGCLPGLARLLLPGLPPGRLLLPVQVQRAPLPEPLPLPLRKPQPRRLDWEDGRPT